MFESALEDGRIVGDGIDYDDCCNDSDAAMVDEYSGGAVAVQDNKEEALQMRLPLR